MILADTSIWIDHLRRVDVRLADLLRKRLVLMHPFIIEELACGHLSHRAQILALLEALPQAPTADHFEVMNYASAHGIAGSGLGAIDLHLLASARLAGAQMWTRDKALQAAASKLGAGA